MYYGVYYRAEEDVDMRVEIEQFPVTPRAFGLEPQIHVVERGS